ncbi:glycoside hydrolase family 15 protein [Streptomyces sp. HPF1205]|uniref:glycoside hydrolase family 15 protein n=1 Tax=Streptomyces sp. HPF1205 TaxID=2873262 RepID=UPI001CEC9F9D|nr:glycoside hydrolase family 15 protein [Streptomyces sp. HPF1205]
MRRTTVDGGGRDERTGAPAGAHGGSPGWARAYPPQSLRDHVLLADGERGALLGPRGEVAWMCAPRWHDDAVFATLIGGAGVYALTPRGRFVGGGAYEPGSLVWRRRWITATGVTECREALARPGEPGRVVLLRRTHAQEGPAHLDVVLHPAAGYGRAPLTGAHRDEAGVWTARSGDLWLRWTGAGDARIADPDGAGERFLARLDLPPGARHDLVLELGTGPLPDTPPPDPDRAWAATSAAWADTPSMTHTIAPADARHAFAVMRGLTGAGGGMVAAATTSLPERAEEGRNYDYRYVWIRDQCYAGQAAAAAGAYELLDDAVRFVTARLHQDGPRLAPAYTPDGGPIPGERRLNLPGYPGGYDVIGNKVRGQFQLDAFGEALLLLAAAARHGRLDRDGLTAAATAADAVGRRRDEPDAGIWELSPRRWTHSRLTCVAGLRALAAAVPHDSRTGEWTGLAESLLAATTAEALHPDGHWQRSPDDPAPDAALLLPPIRGALPASDPRTRATLRVYRERLTDDHFAYRFRHDSRPLPEAEGAFVLCGFLMALAEHQQGNGIAAHRWFERNRSACGVAGLFAEEYDVAQRQQRGNIPQAFVHALLLESAARLTTPYGEDHQA